MKPDAREIKRGRSINKTFKLIATDCFNKIDCLQLVPRQYSKLLSSTCFKIRIGSKSGLDGRVRWGYRDMAKDILLFQLNMLRRIFSIVYSYDRLFVPFCNNK